MDLLYCQTDMVGTDASNGFDSDLIDLEIDDRLKQEIIEYRQMKPLLDLCLNLNHDINNPLAGIIGFTELLLTDGIDLTDDQQSSLEQIIICAERIKILTGKLGEAKTPLVRDQTPLATLAKAND